VTSGSDFDRTLDICLNRLRAGDTPEACLASYPSYADRLAPLLWVAAGLRTPDGPSMSAGGLAAGEARLLAHAVQLRARPSGQAPAARRARSGFLGGAYRLIAAAVASVLLACVLLSVGTVSAASTSLPGSPLYPVKRASEAAVSSVALTPRLQARVHLVWADRRLREVEALMERDGVADEAILAALEQETEQALAAAEQAGAGSLMAAAVHTEHQQAVLSRVLVEAPPAARPGLQRALEASAKKNERARSALDRAGDHGLPITPPGQADDKKPPHAGQKTPSAAETPGASATPSEAKDERPSPGKGADQGQGQGQDKAQDPDGRQGHNEQDEADHPNQGRGSDKDKLPPPDKDGEPGQGPPHGEGPGKDGGDQKPDKPDNPGQSKDKDK
jgi:hypothetical protein